MIAFYILSVGLSAGVSGIFARRVLATFGYVPDFHAAFALATGVALAFAGIQLAFMALLRFLQPSRGVAPLTSEILSQLSALVLAPYLLNVQIHWPKPILFKVEPLIYLAVFLALHGFFKLMTLFGASQGRIGNRAPVIGYAAAAGVCLLACEPALMTWHKALSAVRVSESEEGKPFRVGEGYAVARHISEGASLKFPLPAGPGMDMALRWANATETTRPYEHIWAEVQIDGEASAPFVEQVTVPAGGWGEVKVPAARIPPNAKTTTISWTSKEEATWVTKTGIRPANDSGKIMLVSGPSFHALRATASEPNIILIAIDGLSAEHVDLFGYQRPVTPSLSAMAGWAAVYPFAFTPAPEPGAALMTLVTGVSPLLHGRLGEHIEKLPDTLNTLAEVLSQRAYHSVAFTEADAPDDNTLTYGSGLERGFEYVDDEFPGEPSAQLPGVKPKAASATAVTLGKVTQWIDAHADEKFFVLVRLHDLAKPQLPPHHDNRFISNKQSPSAMDTYDTALADVDKRLGDFLTHLKSLPIYDITCIAVVATYGHDFSRRNPGGAPKMTETSLRVPLFMIIPGASARQQNALISLEDVAPTLARLGNATLNRPDNAHTLLDNIAEEQPVSLGGDPLILSLRNSRWRFTWQSGLKPFTNQPAAQERILEFLDMDYYQRRQMQPDNILHQKELAQAYKEYLSGYALRQAAEKQAPTGK